MKFLIALILVAALPVDAVSPVQKVVELLNKMKDTVTSEGAQEKQDHEDFQEWCRRTAQATAHAIDNNNDSVEEFAALKSKSASEIEALTAQIADLGNKISQNENDLAKAQDLRKEQNGDFNSAEAELQDTIDTLVRATGILRKAGLGFTQMRTALTQVVSTLSTVMEAATIGAQDKAHLSSLLQSAQGESEDDFVEPTAKAYESHSGNIIETLGELKEKAEAELSDLRKEEMKNKHAFQMLAQGLTDSINTQNRDMKNARSSLANNQEINGKASGDLADEKKSLAQNEKYLSETNADCEQKANEFKTRTASRGEELAAIDKAIEILTDEKFSGAYHSRASFIQLKSNSDDVREQAVMVLKKAARTFKSVELAQLAVRATEDPFGKVKGLIRDMVARLKKQANEESSRQAYCVAENKESSAKRDDTQEKLDNFSARLASANANKAKLKEEVAALAGSISDLDDNVAELTRIRQAENSAFRKAAEEYKVSMEGLENALTVLRDYFAGAAGHESKSDSSTGVIAMLETAQQDMANDQAQGEVDENNAQKAFEKISQESAVNRASMEADMKGKQGEIARLSNLISDLENDVQGTSDELDSVLAYLEKLKGMCTHKVQSFAERAAAQQAEIESLRQALEILENETAAGFLQIRRV